MEFSDSEVSESGSHHGQAIEIHHLSNLIQLSNPQALAQSNEAPRPKRHLESQIQKHSTLHSTTLTNKKPRLASRNLRVSVKFPFSQSETNRFRLWMNSQHLLIRDGEFRRRSDEFFVRVFRAEQVQPISVPDSSIE